MDTSRTSTVISLTITNPSTFATFAATLDTLHTYLHEANSSIRDSLPKQ